LREQIVQYLKGELTEEEQKELFEWINRAEENRKYFEKLENTWYVAGILHREAGDPEKAWERFRSRHFKTKKRSLHRNILKYAALIVIFLGLGWGGRFLFNTLQKEESATRMELSVPKGETANFQFADQSRVQLNAGSSIRFPENFTGGKREVFLEGEAYFQVAEDKKHPFIVRTNDMDVRVRGTAFNVRSYPEEEFVETTVEEGKVEVSKPGREQISGKKSTLKKGEQLLYNSKTDTFSLTRNVDTRLYTSWREGQYRFKKARLDRLAKSIERLYDVNIDVAAEIKHLAYNGIFYKDESVDEVLDRIERSAFDIQIKKLDNKQYAITKKEE